jgi:hypothetical protein
MNPTLSIILAVHKSGPFLEPVRVEISLNHISAGDGRNVVLATGHCYASVEGPDFTAEIIAKGDVVLTPGTIPCLLQSIDQTLRGLTTYAKFREMFAHSHNA